MLKRVTIKNFQSHKRTELEFTPGLNVITGTSDSGKSSIMRALLWVVMNQPSGGDMVSWFAKKGEDTHVVLEFDDGSIGKRRHSGKNSYILPAEGRTLEALRADVPEEITNVTRMGDYNIQEQHDPYFLLKDSPGERARKLNELVGLDVIDRLFKNINRRATEATRVAKEATEAQQGIKAQIAELAYLDEIEALLLALDTGYKRYLAVSYDRDTLAGLLESIRENEEYLKEAEALSAFAPTVLALQSLVRCYFDKANTWADLDGRIENITELEGELIVEKQWLSIVDGYEKLQTAYDKYAKFLKEEVELRTRVVGLKRLHNEIAEAGAYATTLIAKYGALLEREQICPTCGANITGETVEQITQRLECY